MSLNLLGLTLLTLMLASAIINLVYMAAVYGADYPITAIETRPALGNHSEHANGEGSAFREHSKHFSPSD